MISVSLVLLTLAFGRLAGCAPAASSAASSAASAPASTSAVVSSSISQVASTAVSSTVPSTVSSAPAVSATVEPISTEPNAPLWGADASPDDPVIQPVRGQLGAPIMGPDNKAVDIQNPDFLAGPTTDHGSVQEVGLGKKTVFRVNIVPNLNNLEMASVNMRLEPGAVRELHWHKTSEWAYVLKGSTQITAVDAEGRNYIATVQPGDLWFFPPGIPHSLQATDDDPEGSEFILVFDDGAFSEDSTFLLTEWLNHIPYEVIQKNFGVTNDAFAHIPNEELYIFPVAALPQDDASAPQSPQGTVPDPYSFALSKVNATITPGGSVKIVDSTTFKVSTTIAAAEVTVNPGGIRELHVNNESLLGVM
ncbi:hypothetical protein MPER_12919 [Moniliophthora perniciosa FA553]|nr:hypothetical protein MPER_12919 [Moniliophthora perniciosa FA553]